MSQNMNTLVELVTMGDAMCCAEKLSYAWSLVTREHGVPYSHKLLKHVHGLGRRLIHDYVDGLFHVRQHGLSTTHCILHGDKFHEGVHSFGRRPVHDDLDRFLHVWQHAAVATNKGPNLSP
ncbi:hypothetical protein FOXB_00538 [Fusarium oxysporum f. sp. conglutinans Fo5176]|uniref:Uncharacterized protein n=1 Tax=Fusarium oxysporum (strain Fo5176) TaxID=660025 RepID=F9F2B4_FUSOF|nr:hypothetical protein FOXB_00538 [Fusarium oxysporum f. sp. conglutinans Fo5176]